MAAPAPIEDYDLPRRIEEKEDAEDIKKANKVLAEYRHTGKGITLEELEKEMGGRGRKKNRSP